MQVNNLDIEAKVLYNLCSKPEFLAKVTEGHFSLDSLIFAYRLLVKSYQESEKVDWNVLIADPSLRESYRDELSTFDVKSTKRLDKYINVLEKYRKIRTLYNSASDVCRNLAKDKPDDIDDLLDFLSDGIASARQTYGAELSTVTFGDKSNSKQLVDSILHGKKPPLIPTGFKAFDERSRGFFLGSLVVLAATTGGGKTTLAQQLLKNISLAGYPTALVPLEMTEEESTSRLLSSVSGINLIKFLSYSLNENEKLQVRKDLKRFERKLKKRGSSYMIYDPKYDISIEELLNTLHPYGHKVILVDYISLLRGVDGEQGWVQLGKVARICKVWAKTHNILIILLAQLSKQGEVRYAKSLVEHSNNVWSWVSTEESRETGILDIVQLKARNQPIYDFQLSVDFATMRIGDVDGTEEYTNEDEMRKSEHKEAMANISRDITTPNIELSDLE
jgi:replicative DNA helicase